MGLVYVVLRVVVAATPTPKDDEALKEVSGILQLIGKLVGLDLKQGRNTNGNNKPRPPTGVGSVLLCLLLSLIVLSGCQNERAQYRVAQLTYESTVDILAAANDAGKLSEADQAKITLLVHRGEEKLNEWANALLMDESTTNLSEIVNDILDELIVYSAKLEDQ